MNSTVQDPVHFIDIVSAARGDPAHTAADPSSSSNVPLCPILVEDAPSFCMTEEALSRIELALRGQEKRRIPRAGQLSPVSGLRAVESEDSSQGPRSNPLQFQISPPLAPERLRPQDALEEGRFNVRAISIVLLAAVLIAALAYHFFAGEMSAEPASAQVLQTVLTPLPPSQLIDAQINHQTIEETTDQVEDRLKSGPLETPVLAQNLLSSTVSPPNNPAPRLTPHPRVDKHSGVARLKPH
jgi:hypothetical protein